MKTVCYHISKGLLMLILAGLASGLRAQSGETRSLEAFEKVVVMPYVNVSFVQGDAEAVRISASDIPLAEVRTEVSGKKLKVYLGEMKHYFRDDHPYEDAAGEVEITFRKLSKLDLRGEGEVQVKGIIDSEKFKLVTYGDHDLYFEELRTGYLKATCYGEGDIHFERGFAYDQWWKIYGDGGVYASRLKGENGQVTAFGDSDLELNLTHRVDLKLLGDSNVYISGKPEVRRNMVLGDASIRHVQ